MTEQWQELKETITEMRDNDGTGTQQDVCKFLADYMEVLEKQMQEPCEDCISRVDVLNLFNYGKLDEDMVYSADVINAVRDLPSVTPQRPRGEWIKVDDEEPIAYDCSECNSMVSRKYNYCPKCGAYMGGEEE